MFLRRSLLMRILHFCGTTFRPPTSSLAGMAVVTESSSQRTAKFVFRLFRSPSLMVSALCSVQVRRPLCFPLGRSMWSHTSMHAVIRATADLAAEGESGAIDEGLANIFACLSGACGGNRFVRIGPWAIRFIDLDRNGSARGLGRSAAYRTSTFCDGQSASGAASCVFTSADRSFAATLPGWLYWACGSSYLQSLDRRKTARLYFRAITTYLHRYADATDLADATIAASTGSIC